MIAAEIRGVSTADRLDNADWSEVTREHPCPICGKPDWCSRKSNGSAVLCHRWNGAVAPGGFKVGTATPTGQIFDLVDSLSWRADSLVSDTPPTPRRKAKTIVPPDRWALVNHTRTRNATEHVERLAELLGVDVDALRALSCGWDSSKRGWTFPHRNAAGDITGFSIRLSEPFTDRNGKIQTKISDNNTRSALFYDPAGWLRGDGPVFVPEGATDVAALYSLELAAVGRPSNKGGVEYLVELLAGVPLTRPIVVVAERDEKPNGDWPGHQGAVQVARRLANRLNRRVGWAFPPDGAKDSRSWFNVVRTNDETTPCRDLGLVFTMDLLSSVDWFVPEPSRRRKQPETGTPVAGAGGRAAVGPFPAETAPPPASETRKNTGKTTSDNHRSVRIENPDLGNPASAEGQNASVSTPEPRVQIDYRAEEQARVLDAVLEVMADQFFVRSGELVHVASPDNRKVATSAAGGAVVVHTTKETVADFLSRRVDFIVWTPVEPPKGQTEPSYEPKVIPVPRWLPERLVGMQTWRFLRELVGIAHGPFLRADGTVGGREPGYDDASGILVVGDDRWPEIPDTPTDNDVCQAVALVLEPLREFPFVNPAGKSVWLSLLLSAVARPAIRGPVPLHVVDASTRGAGKSKLAKIASIISEGVEPAMESLSANDAEMDKRLTAVLAAGSRVVVFDNQAGSIGGPSLDRYLTATVWGGRLLGTNRMLRLPNLTVPAATANNASVTADTARRCVALRLAPPDELPEERLFEVADLEEHVRSRRRELLSAALVILRAHAAKGFPLYTEANHQADDGSVTTVPCRPKGSFEAWSRVVRFAIVGAGLPDPESTSRSVREVDSRAAALQSFVQALFAWDPGWHGTTRDLVADVFADHASGEAVEDLRSAMLEVAEDRGRRGTVSVKSLGYAVRSIHQKWFGSLRVVLQTHGKSGTPFVLESRE